MAYNIEKGEERAEVWAGMFPNKISAHENFEEALEAAIAHKDASGDSYVWVQLYRMTLIKDQ